MDHNTSHHNCKVLIHLRPLAIILNFEHKATQEVSNVRNLYTHMVYSTLTVAANGCDVITAVVEVVALHITVAARVSLAVVSSTTSSIAGCCTACGLVSGCLHRIGLAVVGLVELVLYLFSLLITPTTPGCRSNKTVLVIPVLGLVSSSSSIISICSHG